MIIQCERCESRFNIDERILKKDGSRVRCSVCKNIFTAFPPRAQSVIEQGDEEDFAQVDTAELGRLPVKKGAGSGVDEDSGKSFDKLFEDALQEGIQDVEARVQEEEEGEEAGEGEHEESGEDIDTHRGAAGEGKKEMKHILLIALVIILAFIVGALIVFFLAPGILPDSLSSLKPISKEEITDTGVKRLEFRNVSGAFLQNNTAGQLYVVKGDVVNNNPKSRSFILLKGTILDEGGKTVKQKLIYAGNVFTEDQLKGMTLEEIDKAMKNQTGKDNINVDIKPGTVIPFMIIFDSLPDNVGEFEVEAVTSSPGQ